VVVQSNRCPFCDGELALDSSAHVLPGRVYRATRFVAIATAAALACGGTTGDPNDAGKDQASDAADASAQDGTMDTGTGDTGVSDSGRDAVEEDSGIALPYGAPPHNGRVKRFV
jgi:hypothetical protein